MIEFKEEDVSIKEVNLTNFPQDPIGDKPEVQDPLLIDDDTFKNSVNDNDDPEIVEECIPPTGNIRFLHPLELDKALGVNEQVYLYFCHFRIKNQYSAIAEFKIKTRKYTESC